MLATITTTAVTRGWPSAVYGRIVSQLRDTTDLGGSEAVLDVVNTLLKDSPPNPLLYEYICTLSADTRSFIFFPVLLNWLLTDWKERPQHVKDLVAYLGRFAADQWRLPPDYTEYESTASSCKAIVEQACHGCGESRVLAAGLAHCVLPQILEQLPDWRVQLELKLSQIGIQVWHDSERAGARNDHVDPAALEGDPNGDQMESKVAKGYSSRAMRLLWLDWYLRTAQCFEFSYFHRQLDLLWPGDRETVISYELCVTAFDVLASPSCGRHSKRTEAFIASALPLLLNELNAGKQIDTVISRVFTTLDKSIVESVEQKSPGIRATFGGACVDIGLCDPTVLHTLHRSHTVRPPLPPAELPAINDVIQSPCIYITMNAANQKDMAVAILAAARGTTKAMGRRDIARLCAELYRTPQFADALFVHIPLRQFLEAACAYADEASGVPDEEGGAGLVYSDLGVLISTVNWLRRRYDGVVLPASWTQRFLERKALPTASQLTLEEFNFMGRWIEGLFSGSGSGIADELLRPFRELSQFLPVLLQQAVRAYRSAVLDRETLKSGLDYFAHPFSVNLLAPLVVHVLRADLLEGRHASTTLECLIFFLTMLVEKKATSFDVSKATVLRLVQSILRDLDASAPLNTVTKSVPPPSQGLSKLIDVLKPIVKELSDQVGSTFSLELPQSPIYGETVSLGEVVRQSATSLMDWQLNMQGVPTIPSCLTKAKQALGRDVVNQILEKAVSGTSKDTLTAVLITDGLWCRDTRLVEVAEGPAVHTARELLSRYYEILDSQPVQPPVKTSDMADKGSLQQPGGEDAQKQGSPSSNQDPNIDLEVEGVQANPDLSMDLMGDSGTNSISGIDGLENGNSNNYASAPPLGNDLDTDFVSQPIMNLADLDSAMDFAWD